MGFGLFLGQVLGVFSLCWIISMVYLFLKQHQLMRYLMGAHYDRWCYITSAGGLGPGCVNSVRGLEYVFSAEDNDDPTVVILKAAVKRGLLYVVSIFAAMLITAVLGVVIGEATTRR